MILNEFYKGFGGSVNPKTKTITDAQILDFQAELERRRQAAGNQPGVITLLQEQIIADPSIQKYPAWVGVDGAANINIIDKLEDSIEKLEASIKVETEKVGAAAAKIRAIAQTKRIARYHTFMEWLIEHERIMEVVVSADLVGTSSEGVTSLGTAVADREDSEGGRGVVKITRPGQGTGSGNFQAAQRDKTRKVNDEFYKGVEQQLRDREDLSADERGKESASKNVVGNLSIDTDFKAQASHAGISIPFVTFGDIVDAAIGITFSNKDTKEVQKEVAILSGPITVTRLEGKNPKKYVVNMAHLPISLDYFLLWYQQNVVLQQKEVYPLKKFILDISNDLLRRSLGEGCLDGKAQDVETKVSFLKIRKLRLNQGVGSVVSRGFDKSIHRRSTTQKGIIFIFIPWRRGPNYPKIETKILKMVFITLKLEHRRAY